MKKVEGKEEKMSMNLTFMRICKGIEFEIDLNIIHGAQGSINL